MPALNMGSPASPAANPATGKFVLMNPFSGPKGSPLDANMINPTTFAKSKDPNNFSTGGLVTGIGFGSVPIIGVGVPAIKAAGYSDDYTPGVTLPSGNAASVSTLTAIGGGRTTLVDGNSSNGTPPTQKYPSTVPYTAQPLLGFGAGGSRDAGAGPAFTGFGVKMVTAAAGVADGAVVETGFVNRSGSAMTTGQSVFGSSTTASGAVTE